MRYIRTPYVTETCGGVEILSEYDDKIIAVHQNNQLATAPQKGGVKSSLKHHMPFADTLVLNLRNKIEDIFHIILRTGGELSFLVFEAFYL